MSAKTKAKKTKLYKERLRANQHADRTANQANESATSACGLATSDREEPKALMGRAPPNGGNVPGRLEVGLSKRENASECPVVLAAPPLGSRLSERTRFMSRNPESSQGDCTISSTATAGVPSLKNGVAGQAQTGDEVPLGACKGSPSISFLTKGARSHDDEANIEYLRKSTQKQTKQLLITKNFLQGNFHQGDDIFGDNAGRQCVPNCLAAAAFNSTKTVNEWVASDMDTILIAGNELYGYLQASSTMQHTYMLINELPRNLEIFNNEFSFYFQESIATIVGHESENTNWHDFNSSPLYETLQIALIENDACFVCFSGNTMLVGRRSDGFFIYDSHSRSHEGLPHIDGKSTCIFFDEIDAVYLHLQELAKSMDKEAGVECEVTGVKVSSKQQQHEEPNDLILKTVSTVQTKFLPLTINAQRNMCKQLSIPYCEARSEFTLNEIAGQPDICHKINGDGNCFFRAISYAISNTEVNHMEVRRSVCNFAVHEKESVQPVLRPEHASVESYMRTTCMTHEGVWATEFEIVCTAFLLHCDIYTFSEGKWRKYSAAQWEKNIEVLPYAIYLDHEGSCHYNVVLRTLQKSEDCNVLCTGETETAIKHLIENGFSGISKSKNRMSRYNMDQEYKAKIQAKSRAYQRKRYSNDVEYRHKKRACVRSQNKEKYDEDQVYKEKLKEYRKRKYSSNEQFKDQVKEKSREKYKNDEQFRDKVKRKIKEKYKDNEQFKEKVKHKSKEIYKDNEEYKENKKHKSKEKYKHNEQFKETVKQQSKQKYKTNLQFKQNLIKKILQKYRKDKEFQEKMKLRIKQKYKTDVKHKDMLKEGNKKKYKRITEQNPEIRQIFAKKTSVRRAYKTMKNVGRNNVISFRKKAGNGPVCACACCQRLLFEDQVQTCRKDLYKKKPRMVTKALSLKSKTALHTCTKQCPDPCLRSKLWICKTCHRKLLRGDIPPESAINSLELEHIPKELNVLNSLEQHLVALHIPFMKVVSLPKGGQNAVHGPVVCVPSNTNKASSLPRGEDTDMILRVKLKRKLCYKGYYEYQFVNTNNVQTALDHLKKNNKWYSEIKTKTTHNNKKADDIATENTLHFEIEHHQRIKDYVKCKEKSKSTSQQSKVNDTTEEIVSQKELGREENSTEENGVQYDTCLQPADIGQEVLDHYFDEIYNLAPAEGMNPVKLLQEKGNEAKSFPVLFPSGKNTFDEKRQIPLSLCRYFNIRLMNADNRFARDTNYIFYSQYLSELKQVIDKTQISLRKSSRSNGDKVGAKSVQSASELKTLIQKDEALRFLQPIRGTPSYWQSAQKDLFAMLRQLGIPTWFCSFSAAEFRWADMINVFLKQQGDKRQAENLDWTEKSKVLKSNPVTVARMFDHRFHAFLRDVILSPANPIGQVIDYFYRVEFQQRGSPHMHCLFWVKDAPKLKEDGPDTVCNFIDQYVTCKLPSKSDDLELHDIVTCVQQHSKHHSKSCKKKGNVCRFNFPRPPSVRTFISSQSETELEEQMSNKPNMATGLNVKLDNEQRLTVTKQEIEMESDEQLSDITDNTDKIDEEQKPIDTKQEAVNLLRGVWDYILSQDKILTCEQLFQKLGIDQLRYEEAHNALTKRQCVVLKRDPNEVWINQYNPHLLRCWDANMDIQFVLDPFSCIVYIISYISKAEREMGMLLRQTKLESEEGNMNARQTMKAIGNAYLHHREVGVQEAVYRVCGLHMKECSRKVLFIPVGENPTRLTKPLSQIKKNKSTKEGKECAKVSPDTAGDADDDDDDDIFMTNVVERYQSRPTKSEFEKLCLAEFCSAYRVLAKSQIPTGKTVETVHQLQHGKGYIQKRSRSDPAIIRYPRFNELRQREEYHQSMLQLFLPYWTLSQLKPSGFDLYQTFYETGFVKFKGDETLSKVKDVVDRNRSKFILEKAIEEAQEHFDIYGTPEDAWAKLCPETEIQRHECQQERTNPSNLSDAKEVITDLEKDAVNTSGIPFQVTKRSTSREDILPVLRSLNKEQKQTFYFVRDWCLRIAQGDEPEPFHIFITGGAGTGKSHLIKAIEYEASRLLAKTCSEPDKQTVLLTAFTGTAAFNIRGCTIHHAFKFNRGFPIPYDPLKEQALNTLRADLDDLQILVIDEISMVYKRLLYYIHERLVQIKKKKSAFGGVSVFAVGDFYQLPPVKQSKSERLYNDSGSYPEDYWKELFSIVELNEIMRQREDALFAKVLNSMRTRTSDMCFPNEARNMLLECTREGPPDVLHVYATNREVNQYNSDMLKSICSDMREISAHDFKKDKTTGKLKKMAKPSSSSDTDSLPASLLLAEGARVMLTRNVDVSDGLVNGATGTVTAFKQTNKQTTCSKAEVKAIEVMFDNKHVGRKTGKEYVDGRRVCIERVEDEVRKSSMVRHQFPLKLAWACTAHKVQGMTTDKVVVNLDNIFSPGQAYVALSRVTSKQGLYIDGSVTKETELKIYADKEVDAALQAMPKLFSCATEEGNCASPVQDIEVVLFNAQSLHNSIEEIRADTRFQSVDIICFTETWLRKGENVSVYYLNNFTCHHRLREDSYDGNSGITSKLRGSRGGGVAIYVRTGMKVEIEQFPTKNIEGMMCTICEGKVRLVVIYRPSVYNIATFTCNLVNVLQYVGQLSDTEGTIIMGDFNENALSTRGSIQMVMERHGFQQTISSATTEDGTLIDHVYIAGNVEGTFSVMPTYYSYHDAVVSKIKF